MKRTRRWGLTAVLFLAVVPMLAASPARAEAIIRLDGEFDDWHGQMNITDPSGDSHSASGDLLGLYWANNPDEEYCYWMIERVPAKKNVSYILYFDGNDNGRFDDKADRAITVHYRPKKKNSKVSIEVRRADNWKLISHTNNQDWGESLNEGAARVEFGVSFDDLGFGIGQTIRMYAASFAPNYALEAMEEGEEMAAEKDKEPQEMEESEEVAELGEKSRLPHPDDRIPDDGDVQWSPVPILGQTLLLVSMAGGVAALWYFKGRRRWS